MLHIHNSLTRRKEAFRPIEEGRVRMYVCGMTVYDYCHVGHARVMVTSSAPKVRSSSATVAAVRCSS